MLLPINCGCMLSIDAASRSRCDSVMYGDLTTPGRDMPAAMPCRRCSFRGEFIAGAGVGGGGSGVDGGDGMDDVVGMGGDGGVSAGASAFRRCHRCACAGLGAHASSTLVLSAASSRVYASSGAGLTLGISDAFLTISDSRVAARCCVR